MGFLILTGMSGAGKSQATKFLEDIGYFCIDNMPLKLFSKFGEMYKRSEFTSKKTALVTDVRSGDNFSDLYHFIEDMKKIGEQVRVVFIDCSDSVILNRYKENKRLHPLAEDGNNVNAIEEERIKLAHLKELSDVIIDTSAYSVWELKKNIVKLFGTADDENGIKVNILSFGYKHGLPQTCDLIFDVRFLDNPYYVAELKNLTGNDEAVRNYVMQSANCREFLGKLEDMIAFLLPLYRSEGKEILEIGIGCTGGKHRSVALTNELAALFKKKGYPVFTEHRDILK
ncbi:MAG: RNase adapter RapZ [Clostridia bacterium]